MENTLQSLQLFLAKICSCIGGCWGRLIGLDFLLSQKASPITRAVFLSEFGNDLKVLAAAMRKAEQRNVKVSKFINRRMLDPKNRYVDRNECERICIKQRQQPKKMTELVWVTYDFCVPQKYKLRFLPKSRGQIYGPMGN